MQSLYAKGQRGMFPALQCHTGQGRREAMRGSRKCAEWDPGVLGLPLGSATN